MHWRNQENHWGLSAVLLHWSVATAVFGLFALGWWMTDLSYYDVWYKRGPFIHKSIGILLMLLVIVRIVWRQIDRTPDKLDNHVQWERIAAKYTHLFLYLLLLSIMASGYLISTADGRGISVFDWFEIPATLQGIEDQEEYAGTFHWYAACSLMGLVVLHSLGALKHQFFDKDGTLTRMLGRAPGSK